MSAEILRKAASLMRERAEAATPGPWSNRRGPGEHVVRTETGFPLANTDTRADRRHIASWHPAVALAVADQLDWAAGLLDEAASGPLAIFASGVAEKSLTVARTYLGSDR